MNRALVRRLPLPVRAAIALVHPLGEHRGPRTRTAAVFPLPAPGAVVTQAFRFCRPCGVDTAAVLHANGTHTCAEGHTSPGAA